MKKILRTNLIWNISLLLIALSAIVGMASAGVNLIVNGDFESGDTGFYSDYDKLPLYVYETAYNISADPKSASGFFTSFGDHTSGSGLMMLINGALVPDRIVWSQTVTVTPYTDYNYSTWIASVYPASPAQLQFIVDSDIIGTSTVPSTPGIWQEFTTTWNSGSRTSVTINIIDLNTGAMGNDFALDDISLDAIDASTTPPSMYPTALEVTLKPGDSVTEAKIVNIPMVPSRADVIFSFDLTGSMGNITAAARANAIEVMNTLDATGVDINYGVMSFHDYPHTYSSYGYNATYGDATMGDYPYALKRSVTSDRVSVSTTINGLTIHGGMDGPESYTRVFYESYADPNVGWRPGAKKILLNFGDAFPHDDNINEGSIYTGINSTGGDPGRDEIMFTADDLDLQTVLSQMATNNVILLEAHSHNGTRQRILWDYWTGITGGYRYTTNSTNFTAEVVDAITTILATPDVSNLHLQASSGYESWLVSSVPVSYTGPTGTTVYFDIVIKVPDGTSPGDYVFTISAMDENNVSYGDQTVTIHVPGPEIPPVAEAGGPYTVDEGVQITINAFGSYDPSGGSLTYAWNLSNGSIYNVPGPTVIMMQRDGPRTRIIKLQVTNGNGGVSTDTAILNVNNVPPKVEAGPDQTINEGDTANFNVSFSDVQPDMNRSTALINYGDGITENVIANPNGTVKGSHTYVNIGTYAVTVTVTDKDGGSGSDTAIVTVNSALPVAEAGGPYTVDEGLTVTINASGSFDPSGNALTYAWDFNGDGIYEVPGFQIARTPRDGPATRIIGLQVSNGNGGVSTDTAIWNVNNVPPKVEAGPDQTINEGDTASFAASFSDVQLEMNKSTAQINYGDGTIENVVANPNGTVKGSHVYADNGIFTVTVTVTDKDGGIGSDTAIVTVNNVNPEVGPITSPIDPQQITNTVSVSSPFTDVGIQDTHTAIWDWDDGTTSTGMITESGGYGSATGSHIYSTPDIYTVKLTVTDKDGGIDTAVSQLIVVYDPDGGFVTGGGWINSPAGAYVANPTLTGKANVGFNSKYQKGATVPSGQTEFQFKAANLNFHSSSYDWLVVAGARAQYKGSGTINGAGDYGFMLTVIDGQINGGGGTDKFRIKIWEKATGDIVYDNQISAADDANPTTEIAGGSIVIHK